MPTTSSPTQRKRRQNILRDVSDPRLFAAICFILRERHLRAHPELDPKIFEWQPDPKEIDVQGFIDKSSIRQVKVLRDIALGLEMEEAPFRETFTLHGDAAGDELEITQGYGYDGTELYIEVHGKRIAVRRDGEWVPLVPGWKVETSPDYERTTVTYLDGAPKTGKPS